MLQQEVHMDISMGHKLEVFFSLMSLILSHAIDCVDQLLKRGKERATLGLPVSAL